MGGKEDSYLPKGVVEVVSELLEAVVIERCVDREYASWVIDEVWPHVYLVRAHWVGPEQILALTSTLQRSSDPHHRASTMFELRIRPWSLVWKRALAVVLLLFLPVQSRGSLQAKIDICVPHPGQTQLHLPYSGNKGDW